MSSKPRRRLRAWVRLSCLLAIPSLAVVGCDGCKVKQPTSDSTPPSLVWNVFNHDTNEQADHPGSPRSTLSGASGTGSF